MVLHPRHRGNCADFFSSSDQTEFMQLDLPVTVLSALEQAAARAGRTWNDQLCYIVKLLLGDHLPDFEDARSVEDWRTLLSRCQFRFSEAQAWSSFAAMRRMTP